MVERPLPQIKGLQDNTLIDWEGRVAAIVFLAGCNFRCPYCHSRHLVLAPDVLESIPLEQVDEMIKRDAGWLDGVVISGGEPTLQKGLPDLITHFRELGVGVKLNTNGSRPDVIARLLADGILDMIAMDVKAPLDERYERNAGVSVDLAAIEESIERIISSDISYEFCTTVCPALMSEDDVIDTALALRGAKRWVLQKFSPLNCIDQSLLSLPAYAIDTMRSLAKRSQKYVQHCFVRGDAAQPAERKREQA
jgi:pyruvate formate lyase activating enzyme